MGLPLTDLVLAHARPRLQSPAAELGLQHGIQVLLKQKEIFSGPGEWLSYKGLAPFRSPEVTE